MVVTYVIRWSNRERFNRSFHLHFVYDEENVVERCSVLGRHLLNLHFDLHLVALQLRNNFVSNIHTPYQKYENVTSLSSYLDGVTNTSTTDDSRPHFIELAGLVRTQESGGNTRITNRFRRCPSEHIQPPIAPKAEL